MTNKQDNGFFVRGGKPRRYFTQFPNYIIYDTKRLTANSILILLYLESKPENWTPKRKDLMSRLNLGRKAFDNAMGKLKEFGYLNSDTFKDEKTKQWNTRYEYFLDPAENHQYTGELPDYNPENNTQKKNPSTDEIDELNGMSKEKNKKGLTSSRSINKKRENTSKKVKKIDNDSVGDFSYIDDFM